MSVELSGRHPATQQLMRWLVPNSRLTGVAHAIAEEVWFLSNKMVHELKDGPELSAGLRKLLEAKDCFVRQAIADDEET